MSIASAAIIAALDWLLPSVQLAYLEMFPVLALGATLGYRAGIAAAVAISVPLRYLEYAGAFREKNSARIPRMTLQFGCALRRDLSYN